MWAQQPLPGAEPSPPFEAMDMDDDSPPDLVTTSSSDSIVESEVQQQPQSYRTFQWCGRTIVSHVEPGSLPILREELYADMLRREPKYRVFNPQARYIEFRRIIVDWMTELGEEYNLSPLTVHMAVRHLDRLLGSIDVPKPKMQLVSLCCLLITTKWNEFEEAIPSIDELNACANNAFSPSQIKRMEVMVLDALNWNLMVVTPLHILHYFEHCDVVCPHGTDLAMGRPCAGKARRYLTKYFSFFADLSLQEHAFQAYLPSELAAAIVAASRRALKITPVWSQRCQTITGFQAGQIDTCFRQLWKVYETNFPQAANGETSDSPTTVEAVHF